jgi:hydroxyethylthiazole kinase
MSRTMNSALSTASATALTRLRESTPLVQVITNRVVTGFTANVLLALGAAGAMVDIPVEAGPFARRASGLLVNLGTPGSEQREAVLEATEAASEVGTPWVLDPVAIGSAPVRTPLAHTLVARRPTIVRGNASEILALARSGSGGRGVDSTDDVEAARGAAESIAREHGSVVAVSGPVDLVTDGRRTARIDNGDALLTRVTGGGCALGAVMAAFAAVADPFDAAVAAPATYCIAAEDAAARAAGPGTFAAFFLDELSRIQPADVRSRAALA